MRNLFIILLILLIPAVCFSATESILNVESAPAYNACNGALIELIPAGTPIYFGFTISECTPAGVLTGTPISFGFTIATGSALTMGTESIFSAETPPAYNACNGSLIESITGTPISFGFTIAEGYFFGGMAGTPVTFGFTIAKPKQKIRFSQGISFDQGIAFDGGDYIRWSGNPSAIMLAP